MYTGVITIEEAAETAFENEEVAIFKTRVSYKTSEAFAMMDKEGTPGRSYRVYLEAGLKVRKYKSDDGHMVLPYNKEDLVPGTMLEVAVGDVGIDVVPKKDSGEKGYYTKMKVSKAHIIGKRPEREPKEGKESTEKAPEKAPEQKAQKTKGDQKKTEEKTYAPRKVKDNAGAYPEDVFI